MDDRTLESFVGTGEDADTADSDSTDDRGPTESLARKTTSANVIDPLTETDRLTPSRASAYGFDETIRRDLRRTHAIDGTDLWLLVETAAAVSGERYTSLNDEPWCLLYRMDQFYADQLDRVRLLEDKNLLVGIHDLDSDEAITKRYKNYPYWTLDGPADATADLRWFPSDPEADTWLKRWTVGMIRTFFNLYYYVLGTPSAALDDGGSVVDLRIDESRTVREFFEDRLSTDESSVPERIGIKVVTKDDDPQHVRNTFEAYETTEELVGYWVFENVVVANETLSRLQDDGAMSFGREYAWSPKTNLRAVRNRVEDAEYPGMTSCTTITKFVDTEFDVEAEYFDPLLMATDDTPSR